MNRSVGPSATALLATLLAACSAVGPDYRAPELELPAAWSQTPGEPPAVTASQAPEPLALARWWTVFGDEELVRLVEAALGASPDVAAARARVREARASGAMASAGLFPSLGASTAYRRERESGTGLFGQFPGAFPLENDLYDAGFDASWEVDLFGGKRRGVEAAAAELAAAREDLHGVRVSLAAEVARAWIVLRGSDRFLALAHANADAQAATLRLVEERFESGLGNELDVTRARALLETTRAHVPELQARRDQALHELGVLLGRAPAALAEELAPRPPRPVVTAGDPDTLASRVPVGLPSELLRRRPDVRGAERALAAATARIGVATADLFPKLELTGTAGLESIELSDFLDVASRTFSVGPRLSWPIFSGGRVRAAIEAANAREQQALAVYRKTVLTSLAEVEDALSSYASERERRVHVASSVEAHRRSVQLASDLYGNGLGSYLEVLDAERSLNAAEEALVESDGRVALDLVALYKALGGGWDEGLEGVGPGAAG